MANSTLNEQFKKIILWEFKSPQETLASSVALHALMEKNLDKMKNLREEAFSLGFSPEEWVMWAILKGNVQLLEDLSSVSIAWNTPFESFSERVSLIQKILNGNRVDFLKRALELGCSLSQFVSNEDDRRPLSYALAMRQPATAEWLIENTSLLSDPVLVADACLTMEVSSIQSYAFKFNMDILRKLLNNLDESTPIVYHKDQKEALPFLKIWVDCVTNTTSGEDVLLTQKWSAHPEKTIPKVFKDKPVANIAVSELQPSPVFSNAMLGVFRRWDEKLQAQNLQHPTQSFWTLYLPLVQKAYFESDRLAMELESDLTSLLKIKPSKEPALTWSEWKGFLSKMVLDKKGIEAGLLRVFLLDGWLSHMDETAQSLWPAYQQELKERLDSNTTRRFSALNDIVMNQIRLSIESLPDQNDVLSPKNKQRL